MGTGGFPGVQEKGQVISGWYSPIKSLLIPKGRGNGSFLKLAGSQAPSCVLQKGNPNSLCVPA